MSDEWNCSNANKQNSLCVRMCNHLDRLESSRCQCKNAECVWISKGKPCAEATEDDEHDYDEEKQEDTVPQGENVVQNIIRGITFNVNGDGNSFTMHL